MYQVHLTAGGSKDILYARTERVGGYDQKRTHP